MVDDVKPTAPKPLDKRLLAAALLLFVVGYALGQSGGGILPFAPKKERPLLNLVARVAKLGLWLMVVEPPPSDVPSHNSYAVRCEPGDPECLNHKAGW